MARHDETTRYYAFLLIPGFSTLGFACALDCLSLANHHPSGHRFYGWRLLSETGDPVAAYNGVEVKVDAGLVELGRHETLIVCAGENAGKGSTKPLLNWLRRETRKGMDFGALSSGTYTLALAGLIGGKRVTTHWEYKTALAEMLPDVIMEDTIYSVDGRVFTSAGGAASMDMMLHRVQEDYGPELGLRTNWYTAFRARIPMGSACHCSRGPRCATPNCCLRCRSWKTIWKTRCDPKRLRQLSNCPRGNWSVCLQGI